MSKTEANVEKVEFGGRPYPEIGDLVQDLNDCLNDIDDGWEVSFVDSYGEAYEPNIDNAQSFWLAAALHISVEHSRPTDSYGWVIASVDDGEVRSCYQENVPDESQRADRMRLAILRCAAAQPPKEGV